ncbi:LAGLIDADG family homing endonuclease [Clostridium sp.]|uniref:LAGLIDADG family homing endonuclease n=1 Tax=Clostridium sp. TaxID=1506 RepID=UPI001A61CF5A|nr:LAGLIDADG family homing endonuclease [Clostridium sp.]MBK5239836.1 Hint domain-containing protein [Clostridium sp.]
MIPKNKMYLTSQDFGQWSDYFGELISSDKRYNKSSCGDCNSCNSSCSTESNIRTKNITWVVTEACNLNCSYCFSGDTLITMKDFSKRQLKDIEINDEILAFNEFSEGQGKHNISKIAKVEQLHNNFSETINIILEDNTILNVTPNHPILARRNTDKSKYDYREAGKFKVGQSVYTLPDINEEFANINDINYQIGYFVSMWQGDGSYKKYIDKRGYKQFKIRLAVKDDEIISRMENIMKVLDIDYYLYDFKVSSKFNIIKPSIFANTEKVYNQMIKIIDDNFKINKSVNYYKGYLAGIYDAEGHIDKKGNTIRICNTDIDIIKEIEEGLKVINIPYCVEQDGVTVNNKIKYNVRVLANNRESLNVLRFIKLVSPSVQRKGIENFYNKSLFLRKKIKEISVGETIEVFNLGTSTKTYIANNILVHNCYETHKTGRRMTKEVAKQSVDFLFDKQKINGYYEFDDSVAVILEFIGGEPLLEIELIDYIVEYFKFKAFEVKSPWATNYMISMSTNGVLFETEKVQNFIKRNLGRVSIGITIDGNKELHDKCRVFHDGKGSYDIVESSVKAWLKINPDSQTKITLAPENVMFLNDALKNVWSLGLKGAFTNCVFEEGWQTKDATILYYQMIELADYLLEDENYSKYFCSLFDETIGQEVTEDKNWCFKEGTLVLTPKGNVKIEDLKIGDIITTNNSIQNVSNIFKRISNDTATIRATGIFETSTTKEHPYLTKQLIGKNKYSDSKWVKVKDIKKGDKIASHCHLFGDIDVDNDIAYIVGRYIGDGWCSTTGYKLCCSYKEYEELKLAMDKAHINYSVDNYRTVKQFNIFKNNTKLLNILSQIGHIAFEKNIPREAFNWNKESVESLLKGLLDADGCYRQKENMWKFNTISPVLANDVLILLRGLNYFPTCYLCKRAGESVIEGRTVIIKDRYEVYFNLDKKKTRFCEYDEENNVVWTPVKEVNLNCEPYEVFNLMVENEHTFIANGSIVHNCGGNGQMLAIAPDGKCFPCIRFMGYALNGREEQPIGDIYKGLDKKEDNEWLNELSQITMTSQCGYDDNKKCLTCPIASGCALCSGYNYDKFGTPNHKATYICETHQSRVMANYYFFNRLYKKLGIEDKLELNIFKEWALNIITEKEYDDLIFLGGE